MSHDATIFLTVNSQNLNGNPNFKIILSYIREACLDSFSVLAPVQTILPKEKIRAIIFGLLYA